MSSSHPDFRTVTEPVGDGVSREQVERAQHRYTWAAQFCEGKDVLEIACGNGPGLGIIARVARTITAGDIMPEHVEQVRRHYGRRLEASVMDAEKLPFANESLDVIILFEALYYLPDAVAFVAEAWRTLRPGGSLLIVNANKDMKDFNPSPFTHVYHGTVELNELLRPAGFDVRLYGYWPYRQATGWQRALVPVKRFTVASGLMPKTMRGKKLLKRLVFGQLVPMPVELEPLASFVAPVATSPTAPDKTNRVIYCEATKRSVE